MPDVRAVIAIGQRGQFGLNGHLPWEGRKDRECVEDVARFFELTRGHVLIMGHRTFISVPKFAFEDRDIVEIHSSEAPEEVLARFESVRRRRAEGMVAQGYANDRRTLQELGPVAQAARDWVMMPLFSRFIEKALNDVYTAPLGV